MPQFVMPVDQPVVSQFTPLPVDEIFRSTAILQDRQNKGIEALDQIQEFEDTARVLEQDKPLLGQLTSGVRKEIDEIADQGFVGNRLRQIRSTARKFQKAYDPFLRNRQAYDTAKQAILDDETFTSQDRLRRINALDRGLGLRINEETGEIDESSIFGGRQFASRADFDAVVNEQLSKMKEETRQGNLRVDPNTGMLVSDTITYNSKERVAGVARSALLDNPEVLSYLQDEVQLAAEEAAAEGREFTVEDQKAVAEGLINDSINRAVGTFAYQKQGKVFRNPLTDGAGGSKSKKYSDQIRVSGQNMKVWKDIEAVPAMTRELELELENNERILANPNLDAVERELIERENEIKREEIANNLAMMDAAAHRVGMDLNRAKSLKENEPQPTEGIDNKKAELIKQKARDESGILGGLLAAPENIFRVVTGDAMSVEESNFFKEYKSWYNSLSALQQDDDAKYSQALKQVKDEQFNNIHNSVTNFDDGIKDQLNVMLEGISKDVGFDIRDVGGEELDADDKPGKIDNIAGISSAPDPETGNLIMYVNTDDKDNGVQNYEIHFNPAAKSNTAERIADLLESTASPNNAEQRAVAFNLRNPHVFRNITRLAPNRPVETVSGVPKELFNIDGKQHKIEKKMNGMLVFIDPDTNEPVRRNGKIVMFNGASDLINRYIIPTRELLSGQAQNANE